MRRWLLVLITAFLLVASGACRLAETPPDLLNVLDVNAGALDVGDQLEVIGTGFPEGRVGTVTFSGQLFRPGFEPRRVFLTVRATSASRHRIAIDFTEELQEQLCGSGRRARHSTFQGELVVAFSPRQAGSPPITGRLSHVVLDLAPPPLEPATQATLLERGQHAADFFGMAVEGSRGSTLTLTAIAPNSRAARAGLLEGDRLLEFNGVVVGGVADLAPAAGQRLVSVSVQRGRLQEPVIRIIDADGFAPAAPQELALAAMLVGFVVGVMLLFVAPVARLLTWIERQVAFRLRDAATDRKKRPRGLVGWVYQAARSVAREPQLAVDPRWHVLRVVPYLLFLAVSTGLTLIAFGSPLVAEDLDLPLSLLVSTTALAVIGLMLGGWRRRGRWSLIKGLKTAVLLFLFQLPALGVFSAVVLAAGSSRARDLVLAQGALPWQWSVFDNPLLLVGLAVLLAAAVPETIRSTFEVPEADERAGAGPSATNPTRSCLMYIAEWGHVFVMAGLASVLLLGGWNVPGVAVPRHEQSLEWQIAGAALLQLKCWGIVSFVRVARWMLPRISIDQTTGMLWRWLMPLTALVVGLSLGWSWGNADEFMRSLQHRVSVVLFAVTLFVGAYTTLRVLLNLKTNAAQLNVNPWL